MKLALHLGAHCTDNDTLLRTLLQNKGLLAEEGISIPGPGRYRESLADAVERLDGKTASDESETHLIEEMLDDDSADRIVLSSPDFMGSLASVFANGVFFETAGHVPVSYRNLFPNCECEYFLGIINPATFIPTIAKTLEQAGDSNAFVPNNIDPVAMRWSDVILRLRQSDPQSAVTVWCNEDTPIIWPQVLRVVSGHSENLDIKGRLHIASQIMEKDGYRRMRQYLITNEPESEAQLIKIVSAFLDKYAREDALEEVIDLPGWSEDLVNTITQNYEADLGVIANMHGVKIIGL